MSKACEQGDIIVILSFTRGAFGNGKEWKE